MTEGKSDSDKILYALSYPITIIGLILILTKKEDAEARYHGYNSLFLGLAVMIAGIVLGFIPIIGWILGVLLGPAFIVYAIILAVKVYNGERPVIPGITDFAKKYTD